MHYLNTQKKNKKTGGVSAERARRELWYRGNLSWKFHKGQQKIETEYKKIENKFFLLNCARRFGKTYWLTVKAIECLMNSTNPLPRIKYTSATYEDLKEFIIPSFELVLADCPEDIRPIYFKSDRKYVNPRNGGEIKLIGIDRNPDGGRGNYCDLYIIDEARNIESENLKYLYSSVIHPMTLNRPDAKIIFASTPPDSADHSFVDYFMNKAKEEESYVELNIYDAAHLRKKDIEDAKRECITDEDWQREYLCQVITNPTRAIIQAAQLHSLEVSEFKRPEYFEYCDRYVCMDLGVKNDLTACGFGFWDPVKKKFFLEDERQMNGPDMTTHRLYVMVQHTERDLWGKGYPAHLRISDNNNPLLLQDLSIQYGLHFIPTSKDSLHAMVNAVREFIHAGALVIHPRCIMTLGALKYGLWNKKRTEFDRSKLYGHYDHLAMLMYLIRNIDTDSNKIPWSYGKKLRTDDSYVNKRKLETETGTMQTLKKLVSHNKRRRS